MAASNFARALGLVLRHEGGYVDHPRDPGGATNLGVTQKTLQEWRGKPVSKADVKALTREEAGDIYRERYWSAVRADELPAGIDYLTFDAAVNCGPGRAAKFLQQALGVARDGVVGPVTVAAAKKADARKVIADFTDARLAFHKSLPTWPVFGKGWSKRIASVEKAALDMARNGVIPPPDVPAPEKPADGRSESLAPLIAKIVAAALAAAAAAYHWLFGG